MGLATSQWVSTTYLRAFPLVLVLVTTGGAAGFVAACSASSGGAIVGKPTPDASTTDATDVDAGQTPASACIALATTRCARIDACTNGIGTKTRYGDSATCVSRLNAQCVTALGAAGTSATPDGTKACADALATEDCATFLGVDTADACLPKPGALANGAACSTSAQCQGAFCNVGANGACGVCAAATKEGDPCTPLEGCDRGFTCAKTSGTCVAPLAAGAACDGTVPCATLLRCKSKDNVGDDDAGDGGKIKDGVCQAEATTVGASCSNGDGVCSRASGLYCARPAKTCAVLPVASTNNACGEVDGGSVTACMGGDCTLANGEKTGTCSAAIADDGPCDPTGIGASCLPPAKCVDAPGGARCKVLDPSICK